MKNFSLYFVDVTGNATAKKHEFEDNSADSYAAETKLEDPELAAQLAVMYPPLV